MKKTKKEKIADIVIYATCFIGAIYGILGICFILVDTIKK